MPDHVAPGPGRDGFGQLVGDARGGARHRGIAHLKGFGEGFAAAQILELDPIRRRVAFVELLREAAHGTKVRNFPLYSENLSLAKTVGFSEGKREIDLRLEGYNVLNRVKFGSPNTNANNANFGLVTSQANTPRQLQLALKLIW